MTIIEVATAEIGTKEDPANSNETKYGEWFGWNGVAWCAIFVSWCYAHAGKSLGNLGWNYGFAGCQSGYKYFEKKGWVIDRDDAQEGDIILFDWNGDHRFDHTGLFVKDNGDGTYTTIEGNTGIGNDSNGGEVMMRVRSNRISAIFVHPILETNQ